MNHSTTPIPPTLRFAADQGDAATVRQLLLAGAKIDEFDHAPLRRALHRRHAEIVQILLAAGADFTAQAEEFLSIAAKNGDAISLKMLLNHLKIPLTADALDRTFYSAILSRNPAAVKIMLRIGADAAAADNRPVLDAANVGSVEILRLLHRHGADLHARNDQALFNAVLQKQEQAIKFLLQSGLSANARSGASVTFAISYGHTPILELLLNAGGKLVDPALISDAADTDSLESFLLLVHFGYAFLPHVDAIVCTAARRGAPRILKYVLDQTPVRQASLDQALEFSAGKYQERVVDLLLEHGAAAAANHSAALKRAVAGQQFDLAQRLLVAGARAHDLDDTSILITIKAKQWPFFVMLLQAGLALASTVLTPEQATAFFAHVTPIQFLTDSRGNSLPLTLRTERQKFAKTTASTAAKQSGDDAVKVACWFTKFLDEMILRA
jgi:ankyrin repeat protein